CSGQDCHSPAVPFSAASYSFSILDRARSCSLEELTAVIAPETDRSSHPAINTTISPKVAIILLFISASFDNARIKLLAWCERLIFTLSCFGRAPEAAELNERRAYFLPDIFSTRLSGCLPMPPAKNPGQSCRTKLLISNFCSQLLIPTF